MIREAWQFYRDDVLTADQRRTLLSTAARSNCGRRPIIDPQDSTLHILPLTSAECRTQGVQLMISGDSSGTCVIETSTDLLNWTPLRTLRNVAPGTDP
jgi:hypothetical protein